LQFCVEASFNVLFYLLLATSWVVWRGWQLDFALRHGTQPQQAYVNATSPDAVQPSHLSLGATFHPMLDYETKAQRRPLRQLDLVLGYRIHVFGGFYQVIHTGRVLAVVGKRVVLDTELGTGFWQVGAGALVANQRVRVMVRTLQSHLTMWHRPWQHTLEAQVLLGKLPK
jgi:hypothetical protein